MAPADELSQAAQHIREAIADRYRCWMDTMFNPTVAGHLADELEQRARPLATVDANAQKFLVGDREDATIDPALALAREINAWVAAVTAETPDKEVDHE